MLASSKVERQGKREIDSCEMMLKNQCELILFIIECSDNGRNADLVEPLKLLAKTITDDDSWLERGFNTEDWALFCALVVSDHDANLIELVMNVLVKLFTTFPRYPFTWLLDPMMIETMHRELAHVSCIRSKASIIRALAKMASLSHEIGAKCLKFWACVLKEMQQTHDSGILFFGLRYFLSLIEVDKNPSKDARQFILSLAGSRTEPSNVRLMALECVIAMENGPIEFFDSLGIDPDTDTPEILVVKLKLLEVCLSTKEAPQFVDLLWKLASKSRTVVMKHAFGCLIALVSGPTGRTMAVSKNQVESLIKMLGENVFDISLLTVQLIQVLIDRMGDKEIMELDLVTLVSHVCSLLSSQAYPVGFEHKSMMLLQRIVHSVQACGDGDKLKELSSDSVLSCLESEHPQYGQIVAILQGKPLSSSP